MHSLLQTRQDPSKLDPMVALEDEAPIVVEIYEQLWQAHARIFLPDTVVYKYGRLESWFFCSESRDGGPPILKRKSHVTVTQQGVFDKVIDRLTQGADSPGSIVAVWVGGPPGEKCNVMHLTAATLPMFVRSTPDKGHGILQKFVSPIQAGGVLQNSMTRCNWSPHVCSLEMRTNLAPLLDAKVPLAHRTATFDGKSRQIATTSTSGVNRHLRAQVETMAAHMARCLAATMRGRQKPWQMDLNFKQDKRGTVWFCWCSQIKLAVLDVAGRFEASLLVNSLDEDEARAADKWRAVRSREERAEQPDDAEAATVDGGGGGEDDGGAALTPAAPEAGGDEPPPTQPEEVEAAAEAPAPAPAQPTGEAEGGGTAAGAPEARPPPAAKVTTASPRAAAAAAAAARSSRRRGGGAGGGGNISGQRRPRVPAADGTVFHIPAPGMATFREPSWWRGDPGLCLSAPLEASSPRATAPPPPPVWLHQQLRAAIFTHRPPSGYEKLPAELAQLCGPMAARPQLRVKLKPEGGEGGGEGGEAPAAAAEGEGAAASAADPDSSTRAAIEVDAAQYSLDEREAARRLGPLLLSPRTIAEKVFEPLHMPTLQSCLELDAPSAAKAATRRKQLRREGQASTTSVASAASAGTSLPPLSPRGQPAPHPPPSMASAVSFAPSVVDRDSVYQGDGACIPGSMQRAVRSYQRGLYPTESLFKPTSFTLLSKHASVKSKIGRDGPRTKKAAAKVKAKQLVAAPAPDDELTAVVP